MTDEVSALVPYDDFVNAVHGDPTNMEPRKLVSGFVGRGGEDGKVRIYPDAALSHYVEVAADDIVHSQPISDSPLGGSHVWVKGNATLSSGPAPAPAPAQQPAGGLGGDAGLFNPYLTVATTCTQPVICHVGTPPVHPTTLCATHNVGCFPTHNVQCFPTHVGPCLPTHICDAGPAGAAALTHVVNCMVTVHCDAVTANPGCPNTSTCTPQTHAFGCPNTSTCTPQTHALGCPNTSTCTPQTHAFGCPNTSTCTPHTHAQGCPNTSTCTPAGQNGIPHTAGFVCIPHQTTATLCTQVGCHVATPTTTVIPTVFCPTHFCPTVAGCPTWPGQGGMNQHPALAAAPTHMLGCPNTLTCTPQTLAFGCPATSTCTPQTYGVGCPNTVSCPPHG